VQWYLSQYLQRRFDRRHGTDTTDLASLSELDIASDSLRHGEEYEPTPLRTFRRAIRRLPVTELGNHVFIDLGCGKGRALLAASAFRFKRIIGVEFAAELCAIATRNIATYERSTRRRLPITVVHQDAAAFELPAENCVIYLFNPFDEAIIGKVVASIEIWASRYSKKAYVVYLNPRHADAFVGCPRLREIGEERRIYDPWAPQSYGVRVFESVAA
jgi:SAM-dependent methyltransferase